MQIPSGGGTGAVTAVERSGSLVHSHTHALPRAQRAGALPAPDRAAVDAGGAALLDVLAGMLDGVEGVSGRRSTGRARRVGGETGVVHVDVLVRYAPTTRFRYARKTHAERTPNARQ